MVDINPTVVIKCQKALNEYGVYHKQTVSDQKSTQEIYLALMQDLANYFSFPPRQVCFFVDEYSNPAQMTPINAEAKLQPNKVYCLYLGFKYSF